MAGGESSRMGYPKPWIKTKNNECFLQRILNTILQVEVEEVVIVLNEKFNTSQWKKELQSIKNKATIISNSNPQKGRLYSIQLGMQKINNKQVLIFNVDNPYVKKETIKILLSNSCKEDVLIPKYNNKGGHPILINNKIKNEILTNYSSYTTLKEVLNKFNKHYIDVDDKSILININTLDDLKKTKYDFV